MRQCTHFRQRVGIVTNQDPREEWHRDRPHASRSVCAREECQAAAFFWVAGETNEPAALYLDPIEPAPESQKNRVAPPQKEDMA